MLQRVSIKGVELPRLYIAQDKVDVELAIKQGIPFVRWKWSTDQLVKVLLRPTLEKLYPYIKWNKVLGSRKKFQTNIIVEEYHDELPEELSMTSGEASAEPVVPEGMADECASYMDDDVLCEDACVNEGTRLFNCGAELSQSCKKLDLETYVGDLNSYIDLEVLQQLHLMPSFIGDIMDCIKMNIGNGLRWAEGYNKKLGCCVGRYNAKSELPNLIILDVSGSIPRGISATMLTLIDTLRAQVNADLIITADRSKWYDHRSELPSPQDLRDYFGYGNESYGFFNILSTYVKGKHYGHVFSFGDYDTPDYHYAGEIYLDLTGTEVDYVHHYHTRAATNTGYAEWCHHLGKEPMVEHNTQWCKVITK